MPSTLQLFHRAAGLAHPRDVSRIATTRLIYALQPASSIAFSAHAAPEDDPTEHPPAHASGVNAIAIDRFEGRYLLSGGADSSVVIWDLESPASTPSDEDNHTRYLPLERNDKTSKAQKFGITSLSYYPFDSLAFLTSSYDHTVKLFSSETLQPSAIFDLDSVVYHISVSPIAEHLLVAAGTQGSAVRLIDLRSGASTHHLLGHGGPVLATAWSPTKEHVLCSGGMDGAIRFWDVRRGDACLGLLDLEDSLGLSSLQPSFSSRPSASNPSSTARPAFHPTPRKDPKQIKAHAGPINGLLFHPSGHHLISTGHDNRIRIWDTATGANTLTNFGPMVRNNGLAPNVPLLAPVEFLPPGGEFLWHPNGAEILGFELWEGQLRRRLRRPREQTAPADFDAPIPNTGHRGKKSEAAGTRNPGDRITSLAWRAHDVELYSAHADGSISAWAPRTEEDAALDEEEDQEREEREEAETGSKRKRDVLEDIYESLTKRPVTFGGS